MKGCNLLPSEQPFVLAEGLVHLPPEDAPVQPRFEEVYGRPLDNAKVERLMHSLSAAVPPLQHRICMQTTADNLRNYPDVMHNRLDHADADLFVALEIVDWAECEILGDRDLAYAIRRLYQDPRYRSISARDSPWLYATVLDKARLPEDVFVSIASRPTVPPESPIPPKIFAGRHRMAAIRQCYEDLVVLPDDKHSLWPYGPLYDKVLDRKDPPAVD